MLAVGRNHIPNRSVPDAPSSGVEWPGREDFHLRPIWCRAQEFVDLRFHCSTHLRR